MVEVSSLSVVVGYDDSAVQAGVGKTSQTVSGLGSSIQTALGAAAIGAVAGLGAAFVGSAKTAMDFEKQLSAISAVSGATASQLDGIRSVALQLGKDTSFSASEAAAGMEEMVKAGVSLGDVMGGAGRAALDLAAAGGLSVAESATIASNAMNVFSLKGSDMAHVADVIAGAANASAIDVHDFGFSLSSVGAVAATVGLGLEDTATAIAVLGQAGLKGSDAGTSLKTMLLNLDPASKTARAAMKDLGLITAEGANQFFDAQGKAKSLGEIAGILQKSIAGLTKEQQINALQTIFGTDAIRAAAIMAKAGSAGFEEMAASMAKVSAQDVANERLNNLAGSIEKLKGSIETGAIMLGSLITPTLKVWADQATDAVNMAVDAIEQIPDVIGTVQQVLAGDWAPDSSIRPFTNAVGEAALALKAQFGPAISAVSSFVTGTLMPAIQQLAAPLAAFSAGFLATVAASGLVTAAIAGVTAVLGLLLSPLGLVAIAVGLLAAAWTTDFLGIQEATSAFMAAVGPIFQQLVVIVQTALTGDIGTAFAQFLALVQSIGAQLLPLLAQWGQAFVAWVVETIPPMLAAAADLGAQLLAWIASQVPIWTAGLLAWTTEWVNWLVVAAPLILTAAAAFITPLIAWIAQQVPVLVAALLAWGQEFVAWVAPQIGPLLVALGALALALLDWIIAQVPGITAKLVEWGLLYAAWVSTTAIPELLKALPGILTTIAGWIGTAAVEIGTRVLALGLALAQGIYDGFVNAWKTIGPKIMESIKSVFTMPSFGGGGAQTLSYGSTASGSGTHAAPYLPLVNQVSRETGVPADVLAALIDTEGSGQGSTSPAGARGLMQVMPNYVHAGEDPFDPLTSIRQGARAITEKYNAVGGDWNAAAGAYFGYGTDAGGMTTGAYQNRFRQNRANYQNQPAASPMDMQRIPLGQAPGGTGDPTRWPMLMDQVHNELLPQWVQDLTAIADAGQQAFTTVAQSGQTEGTALVSASTDSLGNVTRIYTENGIAIGATITDAAGVVVNSFGSMGTGAVAAAGAMATGVTGQAAVMATGVTEQANLMTSGALTSVTNLGTGILTTVQATSGTTIATVTDMQGQVTSQYATLANGAQLSMDGLSAGVMTSTTDLGTGVLTIVQDTSGNYIATVTDMAGNVVSQYTQLGADTVQAATDMATGTAEQAQTMQTDVTDAATTMATDAGSAAVAMAQDIIAQAQQMTQDTTSSAQQMQSDVTSAVSDMASTTADQFGSIEGPAGDAVSAMEEVGQVQIDAPDVSDIIGAMKDIQKAADRARSAVETVDGKGGKQGGSGKKDPDFGKAVGGPVNMGQTYLVGEEGPELFTPGSSGTIIPNNRLAFGGGGDTVVVHVHVNGSLLASRRDIEEAVVVGLESAKRRGRV
jgi:TP901 family phage tail tape measure protein